MQVEAGKELEFVGNRLRDIIFIGTHCEPVPENGVEEGLRSMIRMLVDHAKQAQPYLEIIKAQR